jgi:cation transport ATPase
VLVTGDTARAAAHVAAELGIDGVRAGAGVITVARRFCPSR